METGTLRVVPTEYPHIDWAIDKRVPVVSGSRLRVQDVIAQYKTGLSVIEIVEQYPSYSPAEIASAIAYYYEHQCEMDQLIAEHRERAESARREAEAGRPPTKAQTAAHARHAVS